MKLKELTDYFKDNRYYYDYANSSTNNNEFISNILIPELESAYHNYLLLGVPEFITFLETYKGEITVENVNKKYLTDRQKEDTNILTNRVNYLRITHAREEYDKKHTEDQKSRNEKVKNIFLELKESIKNILDKNNNNSTNTIKYYLEQMKKKFESIKGISSEITTSFMEIFDTYINNIFMIKSIKSIQETSDRLNQRFPPLKTGLYGS